MQQFSLVFEYNESNYMISVKKVLMLVVFYNVKTTQLDDGFCASICEFYFESGQE